MASYPSLSWLARIASLFLWFLVVRCKLTESYFSENTDHLDDLTVSKIFGMLFVRSLPWVDGKLHCGHLESHNAPFMTTRGAEAPALGRGYLR